LLHRLVAPTKKSLEREKGTMLFVTLQHCIMITMGGDLQPGCLADRLLTGLGQPKINP